MTRLTKDLRQAIANAAVAHAFEPRLEALKATEDALAREAYAFVIPAEEIEAAGHMPANWFRLDACLRFNVGGYTIRLQMAGEGVPVPYSAKNEAYGGYHCGNLGTIPPGDLCDRIRAHSDATEAYKAERRTAYIATAGMLEGVSTLKRLSEVWPAGEQFYKRYAETSTTSLPAVRVDEVNAMLGIAA